MQIATIRLPKTPPSMTFKKIISERGMNTDGVVFSFDESNCKAYEDHGGGGHGDHNH